MRKVIISGNWKMNKTKEEAIEFFNQLSKIDLSNKKCEMKIFAPNLYIDTLNKMIANLNVEIGCQNMHQLDAGAYTGEISARMLNSIEINNVLVGHSERRQYFNETDKIVNEKLKMALANNIVATFCVGELLEERESNITNKILEEQITNGLSGISESEISSIIVAYEPVWAIGTGLTASSEDANNACKFIRGLISKLYNEEVAENIVIQYGGSVTPDTVNELLSQSDIDGALVGGASLDATSYAKLLI